LYPFHIQELALFKSKIFLRIKNSVFIKKARRILRRGKMGKGGHLCAFCMAYANQGNTSCENKPIIQGTSLITYHFYYPIFKKVSGFRLLVSEEAGRKIRDLGIRGLEN
jgi:hypothetical protein